VPGPSALYEVDAVPLEDFGLPSAKKKSNQ
jgi:hypothetical protein